TRDVRWTDLLCRRDAIARGRLELVFGAEGQEAVTHLRLITTPHRRPADGTFTPHRIDAVAFHAVAHVFDVAVPSSASARARLPGRCRSPSNNNPVCTRTFRRAGLDVIGYTPLCSTTNELHLLSTFRPASDLHRAALSALHCDGGGASRFLGRLPTCRW